MGDDNVTSAVGARVEQVRLRVVDPFGHQARYLVDRRALRQLFARPGFSRSLLDGDGADALRVTT
jgi:hypothetical protein